MMSSDNNTYLFRLSQNEALASLNPNQVLFPIWNKLEAIHFHKLLVDESFIISPPEIIYNNILGIYNPCALLWFFNRQKEKEVKQADMYELMDQFY